MKPDKKYFKFPRFLANDLEGFIYYYPFKFPKIVSYYENLAKKYYNDPTGFAKLGDDSFKELKRGVNVIKSDYNKGCGRAKSKGLLNELEYLVGIDERIHKLYAFRFWPVNYLFPDGPLHEYYVDILKNLSRRIVDVSNLDINEYEEKVNQIQRDLMQGDYVDFYLENALNGIKIMKFLRSKDEFVNKLIKIKDLISSDGDLSKVYKLIDPIIDLAYDNSNSVGKKLHQLLYKAMVQEKMVGTRLPVYNLIIHSIEFEKENEELRSRQEALTGNVESLMKLAEKKLNTTEAKDFKLAYKMVNVFGMYKDVMSVIDPILLPFWFDLIYRVAQILTELDTGFKQLAGLGPGSMKYELIWYLPDNLKVQIMTPDPTDFNLKEV